VATAVSPRGVEFGPESRHLEEPLTLLQVRDLPADTAAEPATTLTDVKSDVA
jgi:hypothetical protein